MSDYDWPIRSPTRLIFNTLDSVRRDMWGCPMNWQAILIPFLQYISRRQWWSALCKSAREGIEKTLGGGYLKAVYNVHCPQQSALGIDERKYRLVALCIMQCSVECFQLLCQRTSYRLGSKVRNEYADAYRRHMNRNGRSGWPGQTPYRVIEVGRHMFRMICTE